VNGLKFPRSRSGEIRVIDQAMVQLNDLVLLVEGSHNSPITVYRTDGRLMAEAPIYDSTSRELQGVLRMAVTDTGPTGIQINPPPGKKKKPTVPTWQEQVLKQPHNVNRFIEAGKLLK